MTLTNEQLIERGKKEVAQDARRQKFNKRRRIYLANMEEYAISKGWNEREEKEKAHKIAFQ